jgi:hypothetical protein
MPDNSYTLKNLFLDRAGKLECKLENADQIAAIRKATEGIPGMKWEHVFEELQGEIGKILDVSFEDILVGALKKYRELQQYADSSKHPPNEIILVPLVERTITSTHRPSVDVFVNEKCVGHVAFTIMLQLKLAAVVLEIQDGKIQAVKSGTCHGEGSLAIGAVPLVEEKLISFDLPGVITLTRGIEIPAH